MAKKKKMVYSVVSMDHTTDEPIDTHVEGTYRKREDAVKACVDYILWRFGLRPDIRYAFMNDVNHNARQMVSRWSKVTPGRLKKMFAFKMDEDWGMPKDVEKAVRRFVTDIVEGGVYDMSTDMESEIGCEQFVFEIKENELK